MGGGITHQVTLKQGKQALLQGGVFPVGAAHVDVSGSPHGGSDPTRVRVDLDEHGALRSGMNVVTQKQRSIFGSWVGDADA